MHGHTNINCLADICVLNTVKLTQLYSVGKIYDMKHVIKSRVLNFA